MPTVNIYLTFDGNCEEAFNFYKDIFGGEFSYIGRFKEMPKVDGAPEMPPEQGEKLMHVSLPISDETSIMGSDSGGDWGKKIVQGNNFSVSVNSNSEEEARRIFNALAENGKITMPFDKTFWQSWFGMCEDKFGINWMVNCEIQPEHKNFEKEHSVK
ncbi:MAG: VOC family protein [Crocinitomicaceae bacterium]|nr:VOC family protein [Crocinitomicaceae bacterium]